MMNKINRIHIKPEKSHLANKNSVLSVITFPFWYQGLKMKHGQTFSGIHF